MGVNKIIYGGETLIDLTPSTNTPETMLHGTQAFDASGNLIEGTLHGIKSIEQTEVSDEDGGGTLVKFTLTNEETHEVILQNGKDGKTPKKGVDYFNEEDKEGMITEILSRVTDASEVAY